MRRILIPLAVALIAAAPGAWAKAPAGATGECKDGSYTSAAQKEGACSSHGGVKKWLAKEDKAGKSSKAEHTARTEKPLDTAPRVDRPKVAAATNAAKPGDATGECKDGSFTTSSSKSGACSGHKGVKNWYGKDAMSPSAADARTPAASARTAGERTPNERTANERTPAARGGAGQVWVNTDSKVYHCNKDALYGKTKQGEYMSEAQAKASGARPSRGKECS